MCGNFRQQRWEEIPRVGIFANSVGKKSHVWEFSPTALGRNPTCGNFRQRRWEEIPRVGIFANSVGKKSHVWEFPPTALGRNPTRRNFRQQRWEEIRHVRFFADSVRKRGCKAGVINLRAESPIINSAGQRPADRMHPIYQVPTGRNPAVRFDSALSGPVVESLHRALPCAIDTGLSALKLTTLGWSLAFNTAQSGDCAEQVI
jgi:hypothetical protein